MRKQQCCTAKGGAVVRFKSGACVGASSKMAGAMKGV